MLPFSQNKRRNIEKELEQLDAMLGLLNQPQGALAPSHGSPYGDEDAEVAPSSLSVVRFPRLSSQMTTLIPHPLLPWPHNVPPAPGTCTEDLGPAHDGRYQAYGVHEVRQGRQVGPLMADGSGLSGPAALCAALCAALPIWNFSFQGNSCGSIGHTTTPRTTVPCSLRVIQRRGCLNPTGRPTNDAP